MSRTRWRRPQDAGVVGRIAAGLPGAGAARRLAAGAAAAPGPELTDDQVRAAIRALVDEIYRRKDPARFWEPATWDADADGQPSQAGGYTALAVLSLLVAGESYQDPRLSDSIAHLETATLRGTYAVAVRAHVWALLPDKFRDRLAADARWLAAGFQPELGGWDYEERRRSGWHDNSLAQYGALGLWEASKRGVPVAKEQWRRLEERFVGNQLPDGGWNYRGTFPATGSMTAAGLTALFITEDLLHAPEALPIARDRPSESRTAIDAGLRWMAEHFSATENPGRDMYFFYYLYGVERVGLASGYSAFGTRDWFREGAAEIIRRLLRTDAQSGQVAVKERLRAGAAGTSDLCFALMFLCRGRVPLAFNKLNLDGLAWNNRPRDVANLTGWISEESETALNWQIVGFDEDPRRWLEAPVLYLASHEPLPWAAPGETGLSEPLARLKRYLDLGGLLLAVNEGDDPAFGQSVIRAGDLLYPGYEWVKLPREHWAYTLLWPLRGRPPVLRSLGNGVRELIILAPGADLSAPLQVRDDDPVFPTAAHVYLYASEMNRPRPRLAASAPQPAFRDPPAAAAATIVRGRYAGNWNPEPMALPVLADALRAAGGPSLSVIDHPLAELGTLDPAPALVVVSGTGPVELTGQELAAAAAYAAAGGVVLFETAGGLGGFARGLEAACAAAAGVDPQEVRSLVHSRIVTGEGLRGAAHLGRLDYRPYARETLGVGDTSPRLRGIVIDGQPRLIFCDLDLSFGLLDQPRWRVAGYTPESARALMRNIILHALE